MSQIILRAIECGIPESRYAHLPVFRVSSREVFRRIIELVEKTTCRILVVDHNELLRDGLCTLVRLQSDMELIGIAASASEAVQSFRTHRADVVLMDLDLPESGGTSSIVAILEIDSKACVIGLLTHPWDERAILALRAGAKSCLTKDRLKRDLITLIRECTQRNI